MTQRLKTDIESLRQERLSSETKIRDTSFLAGKPPLGPLRCRFDWRRRTSIKCCTYVAKAGRMSALPASWASTGRRCPATSESTAGRMPAWRGQNRHNCTPGRPIQNRHKCAPPPPRSSPAHPSRFAKLSCPSCLSACRPNESIRTRQASTASPAS